MINHIKTTMEISGNLTAKPIDADRYIIYLDGDYYGIYDILRDTFVD